MANNEFVQWLDQQRGDMSIRQMAKEVGVSHAQLASVLNGKKRITWRFCALVARKLGLDYERAFQMAGLLPAKSQTKN